ncbi:MAG: hypothetical protein CMD32_03420 [Flavobacteriales bacterium]|nr:hypothetical protein [Flavobacteriales bacterium]
MRYTRLSKEQFDSLSNEFSIFLASNSIDKEKWDKIKSNSPDKVNLILDLFSDLVWNDILNKVRFVENISSTHLFLFKCNKNSINSIIVKSKNQSIDLNSFKGQSRMLNNIKSDQVELLRSTKRYKTNRNDEIFSLISKGSHISEGQLFIMFDERLLKSSEK